ncbi:threonine/serine exporter family protein [Lactiplantibacillus sp. WILCCON 0030]|uniref:Threonine/serine exporter family protein n=1 Tax=Lactiplantibacillus brownii TaxID=3069269 RepID=A0ABU1AD68_9LACO|nr:threonine/serine exporter family protein [Lactiplantibacillus brownii]MDQ7938580.1 threonine/serine exporter family protein [Lactiplantibacillus brownii]
MAETKLLMQTTLLAGAILLENGAEIARVEDTMHRIAANAGHPEAQVFVLLTGITVSLPDADASQVRAIHQRGMDLEKVDQVNTLSRQFAAHDIDLNEFATALTHVNQAVPTFPFSWLVIAALVVSVPLMIAFTGHATPADLITCGLAGMAGFATYYWVNRLGHIRFLSEFIGAFLIGLITLIGFYLTHAPYHPDAIIIGAVMPLVPGVAITNAVRDTMTGNLLSGPARAIEAILSACAIGLGIALTSIFY